MMSTVKQSHCLQSHMKQYDDQVVNHLIFFTEQAELEGREGRRTYPLNVSKDRSLLLLLGGGGRMLSVTGASIRGEPSSWTAKVKCILTLLSYYKETSIV